MKIITAIPLVFMISIAQAAPGDQSEAHHQTSFAGPPVQCRSECAPTYLEFPNRYDVCISDCQTTIHVVAVLNKTPPAPVEHIESILGVDNLSGLLISQSYMP